MLGYRRINLGLANKLFSTEVIVEFLKVEEDNIGQLIHALKNLKNSVKTYYEYDQVLIEETEQFISLCRKSVGSISNYSTFFKTNNELIVKYFKLTKKTIYTDLFKSDIKPIIDLIRVLRSQDNNAYIDTLSRMGNKITDGNTYLLTKHEILDKYIEVNDYQIKIMNIREFIEQGIFADLVIFLGTPSYFDRKFSEVFYGKHIIFLGYSCFENRIKKRESFSNLVSQRDLINTMYKSVELDKGFIGIDFKETFLSKGEVKSEEAIISQFENETNAISEEKVEVKLATISNNNYIFLPIRQNVNVINSESLKITQEKVKDLSIGDLLVFRSQNASNFVRDVADKIMGIKADKCRLSLEKWKKRLRYYVKTKGIEKVSKILIIRYGLEVAKENNVRNWISSYTIKPSCLGELLEALKFDSLEKEEIIKNTNEIVSAHISAGRQISQALMNELDENLESIIDENGYYTFESNEFEGASFNIEEIKKISSQIYTIPENEALKIIKR